MVFPFGFPLDGGPGGVGRGEALRRGAAGAVQRGSDVEGKGVVNERANESRSLSTECATFREFGGGQIKGTATTGGKETWERGMSGRGISSDHSDANGSGSFQFWLGRGRPTPKGANPLKGNLEPQKPFFGLGGKLPS